MNSSSSKVPLKQKKAKSPITPPKEPTPRQEAVKTSLYKKKEWDDQVFGIMQEFLFEGSIGPEKLKELVAKYLEPRHYEAVIEERIAISLCGYPVCDKELKVVELLAYPQALTMQIQQEIPGQYRISLTQKKVFDITHLKKFCSRECWAASTYLQRQIPIDPGFMRQPDSILETLEVLDIETLTSM
ncbi:Rtr1/RPAP2 family-domain-containing protein [Obelidium mucronatum]|nr:Rtr1/RPAP2 family-domain-containing protein [Obelidium mucronatum]